MLFANVASIGRIFFGSCSPISNCLNLSPKLLRLFALLDLLLPARPSRFDELAFGDLLCGERYPGLLAPEAKPWLGMVLALDDCLRGWSDWKSIGIPVQEMCFEGFGLSVLGSL